MPRLARTVVLDFPHHITQRGNNRQDVFFIDDDRKVYLELLPEQSDKNGLSVILGRRVRPLPVGRPKKHEEKRKTK